MNRGPVANCTGMTSDEAATIYSDLRQQYQDNASWLSERSITKARLFQDACIGLLEAKPTLAMHTAAGGQHQVMTDLKVVENMLAMSTRWLNTNDPSIARANGVRVTQLVPMLVRG